MDHFALPDDELAVAARAGTLHRNFMGYTTRPAPDMLGAGVSATVSADLKHDLEKDTFEMVPGLALKGSIELVGFMGAGSVQPGLDAKRKQKLISLQ